MYEAKLAQDWEKVKVALQYIYPDCKYKPWLSVGMALRSHFGDDALALWDGWSATGSSYPESEAIMKKWDSFALPGDRRGIGLATIFFFAKQAGWPHDPVPQWSIAPRPQIAPRDPSMVGKPVTAPIMAPYANGAFPANVEAEIAPATPWFEMPSPFKGEPTEEESGAPDEDDDDDDEVAADEYDETNFFDFVDRVDINGVSGVIKLLRDWIYGTSPVYRNNTMSLASAVAIVSTLAGRHLASPTGCQLNLYIALIARTTAGKNHPLRAPNIVLSAMGLESLLAGTFSSSAALERHLSHNPCALACIDELGNQLLTRITSFKASPHEIVLGGTIRILWSSGFHVYTGSSAISSSGARSSDSPHLVIFGAATEAEFCKALGAGNVGNGLFNRFLVVPCSQSEFHKTSLNVGADVPPEILDSLKAILPAGSTAPLTALKILGRPRMAEWADASAEAAYWDFFLELNRRCEKAPGLAAYAGRTAEQAIRLATLHAVGRDGHEAQVTLDDVRWGISFAVQSTEQAIKGGQTHIVENETQAKVRMIENALEEVWARKSGVATRTELYIKLRGRAYAREIEQIIEMLEVQKVLRVSKGKVGKGGGRAKTTYVKRAKRLKKTSSGY